TKMASQNLHPTSFERHQVGKRVAIATPMCQAAIPRPRPMDSCGLEFVHAVEAEPSAAAARASDSSLNPPDKPTHPISPPPRELAMVSLVTPCAWITVRASAWRILVATAGIVLAGCGEQETTAPRPAFSSSGPNGKNAPVHITPAQDTLDALQASLQLVANVDVT